MEEEFNDALNHIIANDLADSLKFLIESFSLDVSDEPLFEMAFRKRKLKCAKVIFEKGISEERLNACLLNYYNYTPEQFKFLLEICMIDISARFPKFIQKRYPDVFPPLAKNRTRWFGWCIRS